MALKAVPELKRLRSLEHGALDTHPADYTVALVFPNTYFVAMSSLGFQLVYRLMNSLPGIRCERAFFMEGCETLTIESLRRLRDFDAVAFSLSYEPDYFTLAAMLRGAGIPPLARDRGDGFPLLLGGGVCATLNPEPLAVILDLVALGEAEAILPELCAALRARKVAKRDVLLEGLSELPGIYVPRFFAPRYGGDGKIDAVESLRKEKAASARRWVEDLDACPASAPVVTPETDFSGRVMVEMMRGCGRQCRFCVADYAYRAPRLRSRRAVLDAVLEGLNRAGGIALLGPSPTDHPALDEVCGAIVDRGGTLSLSSVRADRVGGRFLDLAAAGGLRSLTLAPETPSERLQRRLNKTIAREEIIRCAEEAASAGFREVKLYYLLGAGEDEAEDIEAIAAEVRTVAAVIPVRVSAAPLVPKARTPLQWMAMEREGNLRRKWGLLRKMVAGIPRVRMSAVSIRAAVAEAALARGDRRIARYIVEGRIPRSARERYAHRERDADEVFPWEHLETGVRREYLRREYERFLRGETTAPCDTSSCRACGVCA